MARIGLTAEEIRTWQDMSRRMFVPFHADGVISQFEGYEDLEELEWDALRAQHGNIQRLDRILRAEGRDPNRYKAAKQADTVMLFYLFPDAELTRLFRQLGYELSADITRRTIEYYDRRCSHGSTLSLIVYAGVLAGIDPESSWQRFLVALDSDITDIQGGTTSEGIHTGVMAGTLDLIQRIYLGRGGPRWAPVLRAEVARARAPSLPADAGARHADQGPDRWDGPHGRGLEGRLQRPSDGRGGR